ncbi:MAG: phosphatidylinositol-specific phospholipase C [Luteolibacter sp.]
MTSLSSLVLLLLLAANAQAAGNDWMRGLDGKLRLSELSIPGTHDAGARLEPIPGTARCQSLSIAEQLAAGVRFLDIRCRHLDDSFAIYHGIADQKLTFAEVIGAVEVFLKANPAECVIMSVNEEGAAAGNARTFEETFATYTAKNPALWSLGEDIPTLAQGRGKIVLFRRFRSSSKLGIDASHWPDSSTFTSGKIRVQDCYQVASNDAKWTTFTALFDEAPNNGLLRLNFSSGVGSVFGMPNIPDVSNDINARLTRHFTEHKTGCAGIIVMDFADAARCELIYRMNLK